MKKRMISIAAMLVLIFSVSAQAATPRVVQVNPKLSFSGSTAYCMMEVQGGNSNASIEATMTLWDGDSSVATWEGTGTGTLFLSKTCTVLPSKTYVLTVDVTLNGQALEQRTVSAIC